MKIRLEKHDGTHVQNVEIDYRGSDPPYFLVVDIPGSHWHGWVFRKNVSQVTRPGEERIHLYEFVGSGHVILSTNCRDENFEDPR